MSDLPTPVASRLARPRWLDVRLIAGLVLVLLSVVIGAKVFADADERVRVWSVTRDMGADTQLNADDLAVRAVRLDAAAGRYVSAGQKLDGLVLTRPVGRGELLPLAAVGRAGESDQRRVVVEVDRIGAAGLDKGRVVDVYAVGEPDGGASAPPPELVLAGVTVAEDVRAGGSAFGGNSTTAGNVGVALLVAREDVSRLIGAVANGAVYVVQMSSSANAAGRAGQAAPSPRAAPSSSGSR